MNGAGDAQYGSTYMVQVPGKGPVRVVLRRNVFIVGSEAWKDVRRQPDGGKEGLVNNDELIMQALSRLEQSFNKLEQRVERVESKLDETRDEMHEGFAALGAQVAVLETHWNDLDKVKAVLIAAIVSPVAVIVIKAITDIFQR